MFMVRKLFLIQYVYVLRATYGALQPLVVKRSITKIITSRKQAIRAEYLKKSVSFIFRI